MIYLILNVLFTYVYYNLGFNLRELSVLFFWEWLLAPCHIGSRGRGQGGRRAEESRLSSPFAHDDMVDRCVGGHQAAGNM
jgi:hypothetical protein